MSLSVVYQIIALAIVLYIIKGYYDKHYEKFTLQIGADSSSWKSDVMLVRGYVFQLVRDTFNVVRDTYASYFLSKTNFTEQDYLQLTKELAQDPNMILARDQLKIWIDSWTSLLQQRYSKEIVAQNLLQEGISYSVGPNNSIILHNTSHGKTKSLLV
jgi:hypothetical protein